MKKLLGFLRTSILLLALVVCSYIAYDLYAGNNKNTKAASEEAVNNNTILNLGDVLSTIAASQNGDGGSSKTKDDVKSDYQPLSGTGALVTDSSQTGTGATQQYDFPEKMYPYRAMLTDNQKKVYDQIYEEINSCTKEVKLCTQLDATGISNVMTAVFNDHPEQFWLETSYTYGYTSKGTVVSVTLQYNETADTLQTSRQKFLTAAGNIINQASGYGTDVEKEKAVYKAIQNSCAYDENSAMNQSAYSALVNKSSVCAGYARAFQYIMMQMNVPTYFCSGYANGGNHAWNIVCLDGKYYNTDISWDDSLGEITNSISYSYFNLSDNAFSADHTRRELSQKLPKCN